MVNNTTTPFYNKFLLTFYQFSCNFCFLYIFQTTPLFTFSYNLSSLDNILLILGFPIMGLIFIPLVMIGDKVKSKIFYKIIALLSIIIFIIATWIWEIGKMFNTTPNYQNWLIRTL